jgi:DNA-binding NarL/FixJ family response regulator
MLQVDLAARLPRLVVVDDQPDFLQLIRTRLTRDHTLEVVGEATSGQAAVDLVSSMTPAPDGIVVDVEMPGIDGFETARRLRTVVPAARIILTSASETVGYGKAAGRMGALFLSKRNLSADAVLHLLG